MTDARARRTAAVLVALALGAAAWVRVGDIEPSLKIRTWRSAHNDRFDVYSVFVESHGGEALDEVAIQAVSGPVTFSGGTSVKDLPAAWRVTFEVHLDGNEPRSGAVRVVQRGRTSTTYDVALGGE